MQQPTSDAVADPLAPSPPDAPASIELFCMECDYCLTGLAEDRCPECGTPFDREHLVKWATQASQPLPFGHSPDGEKPGLFATSLLQPRFLGRRLPPRGNLGRLLAHVSAWRLAIVTAMLALAMAQTWYQTGSAINLRMVLVVASVQLLGMLVGFTLAELAVAALLTPLVEPRAVPRTADRFRFWYALCVSFHSFSILNMIAVVALPAALTPLLLQSLQNGNPFARILLYGSRFATLFFFLWWWRNLALAVASRAVGRSRTGLAICLVPVVGLITFAISLGVAILLLVAIM